MRRPALAQPNLRPDPSTTVVLMGVSGCGKSTVMRLLAERLGWTAAEGDAFHPAANIEKMRAGHELTDADRWPWLEAIAAWIREQEQAGRNAIVTCSALKRIYRDRLRGDNPSVWFVHLAAPREVIAARLARRAGHFMPPSLLDSQLAELEPLAAAEPGLTLSAAGSAEATVSELIERLRAARPGI